MQAPIFRAFASRAPRACDACTARKRKCDKSIPRCALCKRRNRRCDYSDPAVRGWLIPYVDQETIEPENQLLTAQGRALQSSQASDYADVPIDQSGFPVIFFLDKRLFQQGQLEIPRVELPISQQVRDLLGDPSSIREFVAQYFETIHFWLPILSRNRTTGLLLNSALQPRVDVALLFLSIRLITTTPSTDSSPSKSPIYRSTKQLYAEVEAVGTCSVLILQAGILISMYELGHAVYPSAYLSIGSCARYGVAFEANKRRTSPSYIRLNGAEIEEWNRAWWAVLILDRFVNLGNPTRHLATEELKPQDILPMDDEVWDNDICAPNTLYTLSSPSSLSMGRFALFAQAIYLLDRVFIHTSDHSSDPAFHKEQAQQLFRTIHALLRVVKIEGEIRELAICTQMAVPCCALFILLEHSNTTVEEATTIESHPVLGSMEAVAEGVVRIAQSYLTEPTTCAKDVSISPFILHALYQSSTTFLMSKRDAGTEESQKYLPILKEALELIDIRWKAAGAYLKILRARETMHF